MVKANMDIRNYSKEKKIPMWRVCEKMGVSESVLCRRLRKELPHEEKTAIFSIIDQIVAGG